MTAETHGDTFLYNLTLQSTGAITNAIYGNFSSPRAQEVIVSRGKILELLRPDEESGRVVSVLSWECFGVIRSLQAFRLTGGTIDYIIIGSDSGKVVILQYNPEKNLFTKIHEETYGKSGCRRIVPGQYLATDPHGRAVMIGAVEQSKFVYILNRDSSAKLLISSPLEAHKSNTIVFDMCGIDVGFDNPMFACLEIDYEDVERELQEDMTADVNAHKLLTFYELDLGLNHVSRKSAEEVDPGANMLIPVPGGDDGPGGVLVCAENWIIYHSMDSENDAIRVMLPRRYGYVEEQTLLITSHATHKQKDLFFFLLQSEMGDLYKVTLNYQGDEVLDIIVKYFDTTPVASAMCVLKSGYLFLASEFSNHYLFTFTGIGEDDESIECKRDTKTFEYFNPRPLKNLEHTDEIYSLAPITDMIVDELLGEETPQLYCLCGRGSRSTLRILKHGLPVTEMASAPVPGQARGIWVVHENAKDEYHKYIILSFVDSTMVLSIGENVEEVSGTGFLNDTPTVHVALLGDNIFLQVHSKGLRLIYPGVRVKEWQPPANKKILNCTTNQRQVIIALTGGMIVSFELDNYDNLVELTRKEMNKDVVDLAVAPLSAGMNRARWLGAALSDNTVRILSLDPNSPLEQKTMQVLPGDGNQGKPSSVLFQYLQTSADIHSTKLFLFVGMQIGSVIRLMIDPNSGNISDKRERLLGSRAVRLSTAFIRGENAVVALSSRTWVTYAYQSRLLTVPLSCEHLDMLSYFSSGQCPEGLVSIARKTLRILVLENLGESFNQFIYPLRYTPRKIVVHPQTKHLIIIESDHKAYTYTQRRELQRAIEETEGDIMMKDGNNINTNTNKIANNDINEDGNIIDKMDGDENETKEGKLDETFVGVPRPTDGKWGSCIRLFNPQTRRTVSLLEFEDNEAAFSMALVQFAKYGQEYLLVVGTATDYQLFPKQISAAHINVYRFIKSKKLELIHKTRVHEIPLAFCPYQGKLLAGIGKILRMYDIGKKQLLRKCENKNFSQMINKIFVERNRIYVGDMCDGFYYAVYRESAHSITVYADNITPRHVVCATPLDYDTICIGDRFGNINICRVELKDDESDETTMAQNKFISYLNAAPKKLTDICFFHVGEMVTSVVKCRLMPQGEEVIVYSTLLGSLGVLVPFKTKTNVDFFTSLELHMRQHLPPLTGRDHLAYRSYYFPSKQVVDGDLCEQYPLLDFSIQKQIAENLTEENPPVIIKRMEQMRTCIL